MEKQVERRGYKGTLGRENKRLGAGVNALRRRGLQQPAEARGS